MKKKRNWLSSILLCCFVLSGIILCPNIASAHNSKGINIQERTIEEIRSYAKKNKASIYDKITYSIEPSRTKPYSIGELSEETLKSALNMVNQIRFIAGLDEVKLKQEYNELAAASSLVNSINNELTHYPTRPTGVTKALYDLAYKGSSSSNIAYGYGNINESITHGYMHDGDPENISTMGHRRWILNPSMSATGFGSSGMYSAMYAFDRSNVGAMEYGVVWPAMNMPIEYFDRDFPWTISMGYYVDYHRVQVKLTRISDNKVWNFNYKKSDGYFNVNNDWYAEIGCITFLPDNIESYKVNDRFKVEISGLSEEVSYYVNFFMLEELREIKLSATSSKIVKDKSEQLQVTLQPENHKSVELVWKSSDSKIAKVNQNGTVTGVDYGIATITVIDKISGLKASYKITIIPNRNQLTYVDYSKKKQLTIGWKTVEGVYGYEILYSTNKSFANSKKIIIKDGEQGKTTLKNLSSGKTYYFKVRSYVKYNDKTIYSYYSTYEKIKVK